MRTVKHPEERKNDILNAAEALFSTKGYQKTTIIDILKAVGIAKGTFYYYFASKEEVMDAIIDRIIKEDIIVAKRIAAEPDLPVVDKLFRIIMAQSPQQGSHKQGMIDQFHQPSNAEMHQKSLIKAIKELSPVLADVIQQGVEEGTFKTKYPQETVEFLLASAQVIFDEGLFQWTAEESLQRALAFIEILESSLHAEKGSFSFLLKRLSGELDENNQ
ncbi:TetR/AcrR family transcriptional regulator [Bacillus safensis]|uniref:TetR/AcrR family transcriptional regulator n=1 Tax=Bacillus TaxID=1386 RepID=UPI00203C5B63|nr:TetR/AcrR family transcriptional regulator [Bacillus safensis]MCM2986004.1 TetR/AcrR family transcriptional regulator [Bacillus safensis]MCY7445124.1 TetR/AcrR family transcriptional regulator [Bacillus safensis]MCY7457019.1 TetR/AcrR family transcriptional regulator [Bacillus safensis]MDP4566535.1 TetR/AcrR family transcriptional regulator [Bacillus safensis]MEC0920266.1 TetR/AcrR family transcriptional regulator [Bacillus safensis]